MKDKLGTASVILTVVLAVWTASSMAKAWHRWAEEEDRVVALKASLPPYSLVCVKELGIVYAEFKTGVVPLIQQDGRPARCRIDDAYMPPSERENTK